MGLTEWRNWMPHAAWNQWCIREGFNCNGPAPMVDGNVSAGYVSAGFRSSGMGKARLGIIFAGYPDCQAMVPYSWQLYDDPAVLIGMPPYSDQNSAAYRRWSP